jgi:hypothetical protein
MILENFVYPSFCSKKIFQDLEFSRSRALMGETVFTSFRTFSNGIPFLNDHIKRLELGSLFLFNKRISKTEILGELKNLLKVVSVPLKIRISVFESQKDLEFIITT